MYFTKLFIILIALIQFHIFRVDSLILNKSKSMLKTILKLKINSSDNGKIKYTTDLNHLNNYDLTNIYTIIGSSTDNKCNNLINRLVKINKKFVFIDKSLYKQDNIDELILYYNYKQKINLIGIEQPWLFYEYEYILKNEVFRHLI